MNDKGPDVLVPRPVGSGCPVHLLLVQVDPDAPLDKPARLGMAGHRSGACLGMRRPRVKGLMSGYLYLYPHLHRRVVPGPRKKAIYAVG